MHLLDSTHKASPQSLLVGVILPNLTQTQEFLAAAHSLRPTFGRPLRIHWETPSRPLFDAAAVLWRSGYKNVEKGTMRHLKGCPSAVWKVRVSGRGYPFRYFLDTEGVLWVTKKARHRDVEADPCDPYSVRDYAEERNERRDHFLEGFQSMLGTGILDRYDDLMRTEATSAERQVCQLWIEEHDIHSKNLRLGPGGLFSPEGMNNFELYCRARFAKDVLQGGPRFALRDVWASSE